MTKLKCSGCGKERSPLKQVSKQWLCKSCRKEKD